jgi:hypothetical protein
VEYSGTDLVRWTIINTYIILCCQESFPYDLDLPHCFLPLVLWLDKGNITKRVKMHPIILRAAFLPRRIRNASGNGGGVLIGYMPMVYNHDAICQSC